MKRDGMKQLLTVRNNFHNTEAHIKVAFDGTISHAQYSRARKALCGVGECMCTTDYALRQAIPLDCGLNGIRYRIPADSLTHSA